MNKEADLKARRKIAVDKYNKKRSEKRGQVERDAHALVMRNYRNRQSDLEYEKICNEGQDTVERSDKEIRTAPLKTLNTIERERRRYLVSEGRRSKNKLKK